jgi:hypothetical protein
MLRPLAVALMLAACTPPTGSPPVAPAKTSADLSPITFCKTLIVSGQLAADLRHPAVAPTCEGGTNERGDHATILWVATDDKSSTQENGEKPIGVMLGAYLYDKYVPMEKMQPSVSKGLSTHTVIRIEAGLEPELSKGDLHVQMLTRHVKEYGGFALICVHAFETPPGQRPLDLSLCRSIDAGATEAQIRHRLHRIVTEDIPLVHPNVWPS